MGKPFSNRTFEQNPNAAGSAGGGGYLGLESAAANTAPRNDPTYKPAVKLLRGMYAGDYNNAAGTILSPIHDQYATQLRELVRNNQMGGNALFYGQQPALMAGLENETRAKMAQDEGLAYGQAIPQLFSGLSSHISNVYNSAQQQYDDLMKAALSARLNSGQYVTRPGWFDRLGQVASTASSLAGLALGIPGIGGGGGAPGGGGYFASQSSPYHVSGGIPGYGG